MLELFVAQIVILLYTYSKFNPFLRTSLQICGLTLTVDLDGLAVLYLATLQALAVSRALNIDIESCYDC